MKLLKTMVVVTLVVGLLLGGVFPVQADTGVTSTQPSLPLKPDWDKGRWAWGKVEVIRGEVKEKGTDWIKVDDATIYVEEGKTKYRVPTLGQPASLADIEVGMNIVALVDKEDDGTLHARHIVVIPGRPQYRHHVGEVIAPYIYDPSTGGSLTIKDKSGETTTFTIIEGDLKILPKGATVEVGAWVTVISHRDPASDQLIATGVVVHPERPVLGNMLRMELRGLEHISGTITVNEATMVITVDSTELKYDSSTIFTLRGVTSVQGQSGTVFYKDELARIVLVGIGPSEIEED
jgi:hypothetical protein